MLSNAWAITWGLLGVLRGSWQDIVAAVVAVMFFPILWIAAAVL